MGVIPMKNPISRKSKMRYDDEGIAPIIAAVILIAAVAIGAGVVIGAYQLTQKPDVTYNITDTGFSLAGVDATSIYAIAAVIGVLGLMWFASRKKT